MNNDDSLTPPDNLLQALATRVRVLRREQGLTQEQLADRADLNSRHVQKVEAGELNVTISTLSALALALGVTITDLIEPHLVSESRPQTTSLSRLSPNEMLPCCRNTDALNSIGLTPEMLCHAIFHAYTVIDSIGDSGKTATIKTEALRQMSLVYFDQALCPYKRYVYFN